MRWETAPRAGQQREDPPNTATPTTPYRNFRTSVYCTVGDILHMEDHA